MREDFEQYLSGRVLYGDDMSPEEIQAWYEDEAEGYASLGNAAGDHAGSSAEDYEYNAINVLHGFRHLPPGRFNSVLGLGSAFGGEFTPIVDRIDRLTIVEPSRQLRSDRIGPIVPSYVDPEPSGDLPFPDDTFDLAVSFGVLHHIPNVTHVVAELARVLEPGGRLLVREPVISLGDWRLPRAGLTRRERGIPAALMVQAVERAGLRVDRAVPCLFPSTTRFKRIPGLGPNTATGVRLDALLSRAFAWNVHYFPTTRREKVRPGSIFVVATKP